MSCPPVKLVHLSGQPGGVRCLQEVDPAVQEPLQRRVAAGL